MFEEIFSDFFAKNEAIKVIGIWGRDGLELERKIFSETGDIDLDLFGAEIADIITRIEGIKSSARTYYMNLIFENYFLMIFSLTKDYFLIILADKEMVPGRLVFFNEVFKQRIISLL